MTTEAKYPPGLDRVLIKSARTGLWVLVPLLSRHEFACTQEYLGSVSISVQFVCVSTTHYVPLGPANARNKEHYLFREEVTYAPNCIGLLKGGIEERVGIWKTVPQLLQSKANRVSLSFLVNFFKGLWGQPMTCVA